MEEKEVQPIKYIREIQEFWEAYIHAIINEIYVGFSVALGLSEKDAYAIAENKPDLLRKAKINDILDRFKSIFKYKIPKFRLKKKRIFSKEKPITSKEWNIISESLDKYWQNTADQITGDVTTKLYLSGKETAKFKKKNKPYQNKSLYQIITDQYGGKMPSNISDAFKKYNKNDKKNFNKLFSNTAMYVSQTGNDVKEAIRQQIHKGLESGKSNIEIASDLYWNVEKNEELVNKYSAQSMKRDWNRVASYETAAIFEAGKLSEYENEAYESLEDPEKAQYFVRTGGTCDWCMSVRGTIVRLVPTEIVADKTQERLSGMGIKDPNTDIAIWIGKNNIGLKKQNWLISVPGHPHNVATFQPIDLKDEYYNPKTDTVQKRREKKKYIPPMKEYAERSKKEQEYRKPTFIGSDLVRYQGNVYERVSPQEYAHKKMEWDKNPSKPIPVATNSTRYDKIFGEAER